MALKVEGFAPLIRVFDMPTSLAFYRDVLGLARVKHSQPGDDFDWGLLRLNDMELMLNTAYEKRNRPPGPDPARVAAHDDTALLFACRDLDAACAHLRAHGILHEFSLEARLGWMTAVAHRSVVKRRESAPDSVSSRTR